jgi:hypothetical protein
VSPSPAAQSIRLQHLTDLPVSPQLLLRIGGLLGDVFYTSEGDEPVPIVRKFLAAVYGFKVLWTISVTFWLCGKDRAGFTLATVEPPEVRMVAWLGAWRAPMHWPHART